jgi:hypothetical protein
MDHVVLFLKGLWNLIVYWSPSLVGVLVGGFIVQRYWVRKANESAIIDYLTKELSDLVDETLEYWSLDCAGTTRRAELNRLEARRLEPKIKGAIKSINSVLRHYCRRYCSDVDFDPLMVEVNDACTGGNFEVSRRAADPHRFLTVVNATHRVREHLFERRV